MKEKNKCIQYFFDSKEYKPEQIIKNIEKEKQEFPKQNIQIDIQLNDFGVYIATLIFQNKQNKRNISKYEKLINQSNNRTYGQYKKTKTYKPY